MSGLALAVTRRSHRADVRNDGDVFANPTIPWTPRDVSVAALVVGVGLIVLGASWYGISGEPDYFNQYRWLTGGIAGTAIAYLGLLRWILPAFRRVRRLERDVLSELRVLGLLGVDRTARVVSLVLPADALRFTAPGMNLAHRADCPLLVGKPGVREIGVAELSRRGLGRCRMCAS